MSQLRLSPFIAVFSFHNAPPHQALTPTYDKKPVLPQKQRVGCDVKESYAEKSFLGRSGGYLLVTKALWGVFGG